MATEHGRAGREQQDDALGQTLAALLPRVGERLVAAQTDHRSRLEKHLQAAFVDSVADDPTLRLVEDRRPYLGDAWRPGNVDAIVETADNTQRAWIELKWARSAREISWATWDLLKLASGVAHRETTAVTDAYFLIGSTDQWLQPPASSVREPFHWLWLQPAGRPCSWDTVEDVVMPTIGSWIAYLVENERTYPRAVPAAVETHVVTTVPLGSDEAGDGSPTSSLRLVRVRPVGDGLVPMPGSEAAPLHVSVDLGQRAVSNEIRV